MTFHHERRLQRALYHLDSLETKANAWLEKRPYRDWSEPDVDSSKKVIWVEVLDTPPPELSLIIGDCLHNLRCALDNLVLELAIAFKGGPVSSKIESASAFPIFVEENPSEFDNMLRGIDPRAKTIIEGLQPYTRTDRPAKTDPLWWLNKLNNMDKHRLPHVVFFTPQSLGLIASGDYVLDEIELMRWGPVENSAPIARYPAFDSTGAEMQVYLQPAFSVSFGERVPKEIPRLPVATVLGDIHRRIVRKVLPPLKEFLTPH
jgi:hypothetical protein